MGLHSCDRCGRRYYSDEGPRCAHVWEEEQRREMTRSRIGPVVFVVVLTLAPLALAWALSSLVFGGGQ